MNRWIVWSAVTALWLAGLLSSAEQASAHVVYGNSLFSDASVIDPVTGFAGVGSNFSNQNRTVSSNAGYVAGLDATTWANSHDNRFLYFNLAETSTVNFTITALANTNGASLLNPGYSIFQGVLPNASHEASPFPGQSTYASWSPFASANPGIIANGGAITEHWGAYRSNANVTMANASAQVGTITYTGLFGANSLGNTISGQYTLGPGIYSLVVGGSNLTDLAILLSHAIATNGDYTNSSGALTGYNNARLARNFNIQFNVSAVPIPAAAWLFGSGLVGVIALARRRAVA